MYSDLTWYLKSPVAYILGWAQNLLAQWPERKGTRKEGGLASAVCFYGMLSIL